MALAAVDDGTVVGGQDIVEQGSVCAADRLALASLDGAELEPAFGDLRAERPGADPGEPDACGDDQKKAEPQRDRPAATGGAMGGFGD